jgi:hypothetical protein
LKHMSEFECLPVPSLWSRRSDRLDIRWSSLRQIAPTEAVSSSPRPTQGRTSTLRCSGQRSGRDSSMSHRCSGHLLWTAPQKGDELPESWVALSETPWAYGSSELQLGCSLSELQLGCSSSELQLWLDDDHG